MRVGIVWIQANGLLIHFHRLGVVAQHAIDQAPEGRILQLAGGERTLFLRQRLLGCFFLHDNRPSPRALAVFSGAGTERMTCAVESQHLI